ncbi:family 2 encapsulin nanocompartment cargo protein terpene cyclase [Streptomyces sp. ICBB 8177]|uniref:family 2 encapsulin nanocompartment cargo protein terpene cyclase n=1 Tax=Streptomyces sp. ICBB 8177 TaxID=563922 RepID=UPI001F54452B|nr:family 2 encapsulin nanocompartment cargo protein terpene cyclase [Streptomyces sp. ICBB 8177]
MPAPVPTIEPVAVTGGVPHTPAPPPSPRPVRPSSIVEGVQVAGPAAQRLLRGPRGLGTTGARPQPTMTAANPVGNPIPGLYYHPVPEPDPLRVAEVDRRIKAWAIDEIDLYPAEWEEQFDGFFVGRYMVACHPDAPTIDHLMVAARLMVAENAVDDCYCEDHGGSPVGLGGRLLLAHTALDPVHTAAEYQPAWAQSLRSDAPRRAYRSAMTYFLDQASPSQADRYRHDMARLHMGYLAEAAWAQTEYVPEVWEYLAMRQFNNFRPCPTITDTIGGYELPADLHAQPAVQRIIALAGNATTLVNDLYSYTKELASPGKHLNLPVVIAEREGMPEREAYLKAIDIHNDLMHAFEAEVASLTAAHALPNLLRFLRGVAMWVDGNHYWHQTNTYRYSLPDFW